MRKNTCVFNHLLFLTGTLLSFEVFIHDIIDTSTSNTCYPGSLAEWSKALVLGTSPKGRGFESHSCQILFPPL